MKYAILLKDRKMVDAPQIEGYCVESGIAVDQIVVKNIIHNFKLLAERITNPHCISKQEYLDLQKEKIKTLLKRGKSVLQISGLSDCSYRTLYCYLKKHTEVQNG